VIYIVGGGEMDGMSSILWDVWGCAALVLRFSDLLVGWLVDEWIYGSSVNITLWGSCATILQICSDAYGAVGNPTVFTVVTTKLGW